MTKVSAKELDVIGVYKSSEGDSKDVIKQISDMIEDEKITVIGGDFNVCYYKHRNNIITKNLNELDFHQTVEQATHIEGGLIDHLYIKKRKGAEVSWIVEILPKYYSDHDCICLTLCPDE